MFSGRKIARNVAAMATGEAPAEVVATAETPEIIKTIQEVVRLFLVSSFCAIFVICVFRDFGREFV